MEFKLWNRDKGEYVDSDHYCITLDGKVCALNAYGLVPMKHIEISEIKLNESKIAIGYSKPEKPQTSKVRGLNEILNNK